jgi:hypothetical protein
MRAEAGTSCKLQEDPRTSSEQRAKSDRKHIRVPINLQEREGDQTWIPRSSACAAEHSWFSLVPSGPLAIWLFQSCESYGLCLAVLL